MRLFILAVGFCLLGEPAFAQIVFPPAKQAGSTVTILSDGLSEPESQASAILSELSILLDKEGELRALVVNGYGGPSNIRDLLQLRGADLAIVNNDVLAYLDLAKALPEARKRVRLLSPLFHQRVLLLARQGIDSIGNLKGRKIGIQASHPSRGVTARTIFGLSKIDAVLAEIEDKDFSRRATSDLGAVLIFEQDVSQLKDLGVTPGAYHLLAIPATNPLAQVYLPGKLSKSSAGEWAAAGDLETVQVTTVLAAFDWDAGNARYPAEASFAAKFFAFLPQLRARGLQSPLRKTDVRKGLPGWQRFGPAEAPAAVAAAPVQGSEDRLRTASIPAERSAAPEALRILAVSRPPLTNPQATDGGVAVKVLTGALTAAGVPYSLQWTEDVQSMLDGLSGGKAGDAGLFGLGTDCDAPHDQSASEAELCDQAVLSEPLMQAVVAVLTRLDTPLEPSPQKRTVCVPETQPIPEEALSSIPWIKAATVKTLRPKTLIDCIAAVDGREADALIAIEPEARSAIERLKLTQSLQISQRLNLTAGLHAVVAKDNPRQAQILQTIKDALAKSRANGDYAAVMASHLAELSGAPLHED